MIMGKTSLQFQGYSTPSSAGWKGFRHFSLKHHKLVAAKFPFLSEPQIRSRVKGLWNKLPAKKKEDYTYSPEKVRSPFTKKFLKLSPDLFSWSPSKPYSKPLSPANSQQPVDSRPLKSSWRAYLDTSKHAREGQDKRNDEQQCTMQQKPGILVRHSENKDPKASSKSKAKKGHVTFQLFPRRELFATDGAPTDISQSQESRKQNRTSTAGRVTRSSIPRKDLFSSYETATESATKNVQESKLKDTVNNDKVTNSSGSNVAPVMTENEGVEECIGSSDEPVETTQICKETGEVEMVGGDVDDSKMENETGGNEVDAEMECNSSEERSGRNDDDDAAASCREECRSEGIAKERTQIDPNCDGQRNTKHANASCQVESSSAEVNNNNRQVPSEDTTNNPGNGQEQLPVCPPDNASESAGVVRDGASVEEEERIVAEILTELGIIIAQEVSPERRKKAISKQVEQESQSTSDNLVGVSNLVENEDGGNCWARPSHSGHKASGNEGSCDLRSSSGDPEAKDNLDENNNQDLVEQPSTTVTATTECTSQSGDKEETKRRGRPPKQKGSKSKDSNNNNTSAQNDPAKSTNVPDASDINDEDSVRLPSPPKQIASPPEETTSQQNQAKLFHLRRSPRNLRRSPRLADLELQKMHIVYDIRKQLKSPSKLKSPPKQSPRKQTNDEIPEPPSTPPRSPSPEPPKFSSPEFRVYEFNDEPEGKPKFSLAVSPTKRLSPSGIQSCIVPQCANSDDDGDDNDDITSPVPVPQSPVACVSPAWVDSTAKRLINKGLLKNKADKKKSAEEYNLDSINNAQEFEADKTRSHRTPSKRKRKSKLPVSIKFAAKKRRQVKKTATDLLKRKRNRKSKKQLIPPVTSNDVSSDASKAQNEEDELLQAISSLESESDPVASLLPMSPEQLFEEQHDLFGEDVSSPLSLVKDAADSWMYRYYEHSSVECSSDSEDNFISFRKDPTAIEAPMSASQKLCKKFAEFCNNLSQSSSGSSSISLSNDDEEEETVMELTLNAAALSPLYSMEDSEAYEADLPDVDSVTKLLCDVDYNDEQQVESAALSAITSVLSSALDCLQDNNGLDLEDTNHIVEDLQPQLPSSENPSEQQDNQTCENEKDKEVVNPPQQMHIESSEGDLPDDDEAPNNQETDTIQEQVPEGNANKAREQKEDEELEDIIDQALKLSGITEESTTTNNSNQPPDLADATEAEIFLQDTAATDNTPKSTGCIDEGPNKSSNFSGDDDLLCNLFHQISPSPPRASHIPTPRASGRRLIASNRVETVNNFGGLFEDEDIFM